MKQLILNRWCNTPYGTFGRIAVSNRFFYTVECPWKDNQKNISCIKPGLYNLTLGIYYHGDGPGGKPDYPAYVLQNVDGHDEVKIHIANYFTDVKACIGLGLTIGWDIKRNIPMVVSSGDAYRYFMQTMNGDTEAQLTINWMDDKLASVVY